MFSARNGFYFGSDAFKIGIVSSADYMSAAIKPDGTLWVWGIGDKGNLGLNDTIDRSFPVQLGTSNWSQIAVNPEYDTMYAIRSDSTLWIWGDGSTGANASNSTINRSSPVQITTKTNWNSLSLGGAIDDLNQLFVWGSATFGSLGLGDRVNRSSPTQLGGSWMKAVITDSVSSGIKGDGTLWTWGSGLNGSLGTNDTISRSSPVQIISTEKFNQISVFGSGGGGGGGAISDNLSLWVWGYNPFSVLPTGDTIDRSSPVQIAGTWSSVSLSNRRGYGIKTDGSLWGWGVNDGMLGVNPTQSWSQISSVAGHTLAIRNDGSLWAWGLSNYGQLGLNDIVNVSTPTLVSSESYVQVSASLNSSYAIKNDNSLWVWGRNQVGQLATGDTINRSSPVQVNGNSWIQLNASKQTDFIFGISSNNLLYGWGTNNNGQLGLGDTVNRSSPVQIGTSTWLRISAGSNHSIAIRNDNTLWAWGLNGNGQLGQGDTINRSSPVQVAGSYNFIAAGGFFSLATTSDSLLYGWGLNSNGQLGINATTNRSSPVQVGTSSWSQISAGTSFTLGITINNSVEGWGQNSSGQLGLQNTTASRSNPVQIPLFSSPNLTSSNIMVIAGSDTSFHINLIGSLWGWGNNTNGQLGVVPTAASYIIPQHVDPIRLLTSPIQLGVGNSWSMVSAVTYEPGAITSNPSLTGAMATTIQNELYIWGLNSGGSTPFYRIGSGSRWGVEPVPIKLNL